MRRKIGVGLTVVLLLIIIGAVASLKAYEQNAVLPALAPIHTVRSSTIVQFNGNPIGVCEGKWESWNRAHEVCHYMQPVPEEGINAGDVFERVFYDGTLFTRVNNEVVWTASADQYYNPNRTLNEALFGVPFAAVLTQVGPVVVDGIPTTHYQYWSTDESYNAFLGGQVVFDLFLTADNLVVKDQMNIRGMTDTYGTSQGELVEIWRYYDFNSPIQVAPPPAMQVQAQSAEAITIKLFAPSMQYGLRR